MSNCPTCQAELTDDFGLIDCPGCGAVLFIDMNGVVSAQEANSSQGVQSEPEDNFEFSTEADPLEPEPDSSFQAFEDEPPDAEFSLDPDLEPQLDSIETANEVATPAPSPVDSEMALESYGEDAQDEPLVVAPPVLSSILPGEDLTNLANAIDNGVDVGGLRYTLIIQGIDTSDLRKETREALLDSKFGWDADQMLKSIHAGKLEIKSISAIKAQIVIQRLKVLPLTISWEQHADV